MVNHGLQKEPDKKVDNSSIQRWLLICEQTIKHEKATNKLYKDK